MEQKNINEDETKLFRSGSNGVNCYFGFRYNTGMLDDVVMTANSVEPWQTCNIYFVVAGDIGRWSTRTLPAISRVWEPLHFADGYYEPKICMLLLVS